MTTCYTRVALLHLHNLADDWLRFGRPAREDQIDRRRSIAYFASGAVFGFIRWRGAEYGGVYWRLWVLRAVQPTEPAVSLFGVDPGAEILLCAATQGQIRQAFRLIDAVDALGLDPADVAPSYWQMAHNRLAAHRTPRAYSRQLHEVHLRHQALAP